ncbi:MAG: Uma2 family endonuclease [Deltaproteobacteria bacterium]|nr:Uma2 family endonuclease [Deltaproteobacteria bacterium]
MSDGHRKYQRGPFRPGQLRSGDPYELSQGHPVFCAPTGRDGTGPNGLGFAVLDSDPAVHNAGVDTGLALGPDSLRAPDVTVNFEGGDGTWATQAPLAVEYAGRGQDEAELRTKVAELLAAGTRWVWVVRLVGPRRVEIHEPGVAMRTVGDEATLTAPGVLKLPVPVRALYDRDAAHEVTLRNLLDARGYGSLDAVRKEAREEGREGEARPERHHRGARTALEEAKPARRRLPLRADHPPDRSWSPLRRQPTRGRAPATARVSVAPCSHPFNLP